MHMTNNSNGKFAGCALSVVESPDRDGVAAGTQEDWRNVPIIESYSNCSAGYHPVLIRDGWQIAQLNYERTLRLSAIRRMDRHLATDEVFVLVKGAPVLIGAEETPTGLRFEALRIMPGLTYNIPIGQWHNIAMRPGDVVIVVEKSLTHERDFEYRDLNTPELRDLRVAVSKARKGGGR